MKVIREDMIARIGVLNGCVICGAVSVDEIEHEKECPVGSTDAFYIEVKELDS